MTRTSIHRPSKVTKTTSAPVLKLRDTSKVGKSKLEEMYQAALENNTHLEAQVAQLKEEKEGLKSRLVDTKGEEVSNDDVKAGGVVKEDQKVKELQRKMHAQGEKIWLLEDQARQCPSKGYHGFKVRLPAKGI